MDDVVSPEKEARNRSDQPEWLPATDRPEREASHKRWVGTLDGSAGKRRSCGVPRPAVLSTRRHCLSLRRRRPAEQPCGRTNVLPENAATGGWRFVPDDGAERPSRQEFAQRLKHTDPEAHRSARNNDRAVEDGSVRGRNVVHATTLRSRRYVGESHRWQVSWLTGRAVGVRRRASPRGAKRSRRVARTHRAERRPLRLQPSRIVEIQ